MSTMKRHSDESGDVSNAAQDWGQQEQEAHDTATFLRRLYEFVDDSLHGSARLTLSPDGLAVLWNVHQATSGSSSGPGMPAVGVDALQGFPLKSFSELIAGLRDLQRLRVEATESALGRGLLHGSTDAVTGHMQEAPVHLFPGLEVLELLDCANVRVTGLASLRKSLRRVTAARSIESIGWLLRRCMGDTSSAKARPWTSLRQLALPQNDLSDMEGLRLLPNLQVLDLSRNRISRVEHLQECTHLRYLNIGFNKIRRVEHINAVMGNVTTLILRRNRIANVGALCKLYSLEKLDLSDNLIASMHEVRSLSALPFLEALWLTGNPISFSADYRRRTVAIFATHVGQVEEFLLDESAVTDRERVSSEKLFGEEERAKLKAEELNRKHRPLPTTPGMPHHERSRSLDISSASSHHRNVSLYSATVSPGKLAEKDKEKATRKKKKKNRKKRKLKKRVVAIEESATGKRHTGDTPVQYEAGQRFPGEVGEQKDAMRAHGKGAASESLRVSEFAQHIDVLRDQMGPKWMTILAEFQSSAAQLHHPGAQPSSQFSSPSASSFSDSTSDAELSHSKTPQNKRRGSSDEQDSMSHSRSGGEDAGALGLQSSVKELVDATETPQHVLGQNAALPAVVRRYLEKMEDCLVFPSAKDGDLSSPKLDLLLPPVDPGLEDLLLSYECVVWRAGSNGGSKEVLILSINSSGFRELDAKWGRVLKARRLKFLDRVKIEAHGSLSLFWKNAKDVDPSLSDKLPPQDVNTYGINDENVLYDLVELLSAKMGLDVDTDVELPAEEEQELVAAPFEMPELEMSSDESASDTVANHAADAKDSVVTQHGQSDKPEAKQEEAAFEEADVPKTTMPKRSSLTMALEEAEDFREAVKAGTSAPETKQARPPGGALVVDNFFEQNERTLEQGHESGIGGVDTRPSSSLPALTISSGQDYRLKEKKIAEAQIHIVFEAAVASGPDEQKETGAKVSVARRPGAQPERQVYLLLTRTHFFCLAPSSRKGSSQKGGNRSGNVDVVVEERFQSISKVILGFFLQYIRVEFSRQPGSKRGRSCLLMTRERTLTHQIVSHLTNLKKKFGATLEVESDDVRTIQRIQLEALGGVADNIRLYALLFMDSEDPKDKSAYTSISLLVTDSFLFLCEEDFLETEGLKSRFVIKAVEPLSELSHVVLVSAPAKGRPGQFSLFFGQRNIFAQQLQFSEAREWKLRSFSNPAMHRIEKQLSARLPSSGDAIPPVQK